MDNSFLTSITGDFAVMRIFVLSRKMSGLRFVDVAATGVNEFMTLEELVQIGGGVGFFATQTELPNIGVAALDGGGVGDISRLGFIIAINITEKIGTEEGKRFRWLVVS